MTKLVIKKRKALRLLNDKLSNGSNILTQIHNIRNQSDFDKMIDVHEIWWNSTGEALKQIFDDSSIANNFLSVEFFVPQTKTFSQEVTDFTNEMNNDLLQIRQIISDIENNIYQSTNKFEFTYDGVIAYLKNNRIIAIILILILIFIGISNVIDNYVKTKDNLKKIKTENNSINKVKVDTVHKVKLDITEKK